MKLTRLIITVLAAAAVWAQSGNELFQQALLKERSQGDLAGAIRIYERIVKEHGADRKLAARAMLQIAQCQERQGGESARRTYERLVKEFADQADAVTEARARISALAAPAMNTSAPRVRQLWKGQDVDTEGSVSPDGRWLTFPNWDTGDLGLRDLQLGRNRLLTNTGGWQKSGGQFAQDSKFSPDGKQIAYNWFVEAGSGYEVRVMNADGTGVQTLAFKGIRGYAIPKAWSPDGNLLAIVHVDSGGLESLHLVTLPNGAMRTLIAPRKTPVGGVAFSPDGRWVAFDSWGDVRGDIHVMPVSGGEPTDVVTHPAIDIAPAWSEDGRSILFVSNRDGSYGLYRIPVENGRAAGNTQLVKGELGSGIWPVGFSRAGAFHYGLTIQGMDIYELDYDPATGKLSKPALVSERLPGRNSNPTYSPDGKYLAWGSSSSRVQEGQVVVRNLATNEEKLYPVAGRINSLTWAPDSRRILFQGSREEPNTSELNLLDLSTGRVSLFHKVTPSRNRLSPVFSADGTKIYMVWREWPKDEWQVVSLEVASKQTTPLFQYSSGTGSAFQSIHSLALSPDGQTLAFVRRLRKERRAELLLLPVTGGEARVVAEYETQNENQVGVLSFLPDGKSILARHGKEKGAPGVRNPSGLLRFDLATGRMTPLDFEGNWIQSPSVHPSGKKIAFQMGMVETELWVAENILPPAR